MFETLVHYSLHIYQYGDQISSDSDYGSDLVYFFLPIIITPFPRISILIMLYKMLPFSTYKRSFFYYVNKILYKYKKKIRVFF